MVNNAISRMSKKKKAILLVLIAAAIIAAVFILHSCRGPSDEYSDEEQMQTAVVERMTISKTVSSPGEIKSSLEEKKTPHAGYNLEKVIVSKGQAVSEGNTILTYTNGQAMVAPYNCVVTDWDLPDPKQAISNENYVTIAGTDVLTIELTVKENEVSLLRKGNPATIKVDAIDKKYKGEVYFISDIGDYEEGTSTFKVRVIFDNDGNLKLGMNGKAKIVLGKAEDVLAVPVAAVTEDGDTSFVTVQKGDDSENAEMVEVKTGLSDGTYTEITSGLKEGDIVQYYEYYDEYEEYDEYVDEEAAY